MKRRHAACLLFLAACHDEPQRSAPSARPSASAAPSASGSAAPESKPELATPSPIGAAIARAPQNDALFVADEDHHAVRRVALPFDRAPVKTANLPGAPAQLVALADRLLVTVRDPGMLLILAPDTLDEIVRVELPPDAWGIAVDPAEKLALVTSAWSHRVSAIDLEKRKVSWSLEVGREPRGVAIVGGHAYVSHLVGAALTRVDWQDKPAAKRIDLPPAPSRTAAGSRLDASLGYALVPAPDERRLFVARHALGALGFKNAQSKSWFGAATVDTLLVADDSPLAPMHVPGAIRRTTDADKDADYSTHPAIDDKGGPLPLAPFAPFAEPRAIVYRARERTLLVASEGTDELVELDATAIEPALAVVWRYPLRDKSLDGMDVAASGGAPSGIALSADGKEAYAFCRSTYDVVLVSLEPHPATEHFRAVHLAEDPLIEGVDDKDPAHKFREAARIGRRLFYNATDTVTSGGIACAGCHPDGRDDGHTWHQLVGPNAQGEIFVGGADIIGPGKPRQTPMLAGRVNAQGPYGWNGESKDLPARLVAGFGLHRWEPAPGKHTPGELETRAGAIAAFLRKGLVPPPRLGRELDDVERHGREVFQNPVVGCTACHAVESEYTDRSRVEVAVPERAGFKGEKGTRFKTPSLSFVSGTPPYFHNGSATTLEDLVFGNDDRMGKTKQLSDADKNALVAFLKTL